MKTAIETTVTAAAEKQFGSSTTAEAKAFISETLRKMGHRPGMKQLARRPQAKREAQA